MQNDSLQLVGPYLYLFFGMDDSIVDDFAQRGDHNSGPMRNPKLTGMVM